MGTKAGLARNSAGEITPARAAAPAPVVSAIIPCLNEEATIGICVAKALDAFARRGIAGEVVVGDNGSTDRSVEIAEGLGARVVHQPVKGYGAAITAAAAAARGKFLIMADADDSYDWGQLDEFIDALEAGADLVMGNRFAGGIERGAMPLLNRRIGNPVLTAIGRRLFRSQVSDFHCGLRAFRRDAIVRLGLSAPGMEYASEMVIKASLGGLRVSEVPTTLAVGPSGRAPHLRPWRDGWRHLRLLLLFSPRWLFFYPGLALSIVGAAVIVALLPGPLDVGGLRFDVDTLLFAGGAVILGFQAVVFAVFARIYGMTQGFLPEDPQLRRLFGFVTLEVGVAVGVALLAGGIAGSAYALVYWGDHSFGSLDYSVALRVVVPSVVLLVIGAQTIFSSFFLSFLGLRDRHARRPGL
jgi:glycosyltransferase involved in cell wall biosynthesis